MFRTTRTGRALVGLGFLGLILMSCTAPPPFSRQTPGPSVAVARAAATPIPATPTKPPDTGSSPRTTPATSTSLIAIGSLGTLIPGTPTAAAPSATASPAAPSAAAAPSPRPAASPAAASVQTAGPARAVPAVALQPDRSARGEYALRVPAGWALNVVPGTGAIIITPPRQEDPAIYIIPAIRVSDVRYQAILNRCNQQFSQNPLGSPDFITSCIEPAVRSQLADSSHPWSPQAAFPVILALASGTGTSASSPTLVPLTSTEVRYTVLTRKNGQTVEDWGYLAMTYLPNPLLASSPGQPGVTSLAFLSGCEAPASQADSFRLVCDSVLRSFQPSQQWTSNLAKQVMDSYLQEYQILIQIGESVVQGFGIRSAMISQFGASMQQMQLQTYQNIQTASLRTGQSWIAAFGNNVYLQDPNTGKIYVAPDGYGAYCLNAAGNQILLGGSELVPGTSGGGPGNTCATLLRPQTV